jgi:benzoyl-CoA reductase subunit B
MAEERWKSKRLDCWDQAKQLRMDYYKNYAQAHEKGGIRWAGSAWAFSSIPAGLGEDVWSLTGEPYGASVAWNKDFAAQCHEAAQAKGYARDLCAYMRNYWGSILLNKYVFGGEWPDPDFSWTCHTCCSHAKWYQVASELEGGVPMFSIDGSVGPYNELDENRLNYLVDQMQEGIEWMEKVTGRKYNDELLIQAVYNECRATSLWAEICTLNKAVPAPLDEKSMYSLYVFGTLMKHRKECVDFYTVLRDEVQDRVDNQIAAVATERFRVITDTQPPWAFLSIFRYMESKGTVSVGSLYTFSLIGIWEVKEDGTWGPRTPPEEGTITTREEALRTIAEWTASRPEWQHFYSPELKTEMLKRIVKEWKVDGVMLHYNRGCEGLSVGIAENKLGLKKAGIPVMSFEGNMGDEREFDPERTKTEIDTFLEILGAL